MVCVCDVVYYSSLAWRVCDVVYYSSLAWRVRPKHYQSDGVSNVRYNRVTIEKRPLYTWIYVSLPEPPDNFKGYHRSLFSGTESLWMSVRWLAVTVLMLMVVMVVKQT